MDLDVANGRQARNLGLRDRIVCQPKALQDVLRLGGQEACHGIAGVPGKAHAGA